MDTITVTASFPFHFKPEHLIYHRLQDCDAGFRFFEFSVQSLLFSRFVCALCSSDGHFESRQNDATSRGRVKCHVTSSLCDPGALRTFGSRNKVTTSISPPLLHFTFQLHRSPIRKPLQTSYSQLRMVAERA